MAGLLRYRIDNKRQELEKKKKNSQSGRNTPGGRDYMYKILGEKKSAVEFCGEFLVNRLNIYNTEQRRNGI